jgi:hypothetical protein
MISTWSTSICRASIKIKVTHNEPINRVWHLNISKPKKELSFASSSAWSKNVRENPGFRIDLEVNSTYKQ